MFTEATGHPTFGLFWQNFSLEMLNYSHGLNSTRILGILKVILTKRKTRELAVE